MLTVIRMNIFIVLMMCASVSANGGVMFVKDYPKHAEYVENPNNFTMVLLGEMEDCETFMLQNNAIFNEERFIVRRKVDINYSCGFSESLVDGRLLYSFDEIFNIYSTPAGAISEFGGLKTILSTPYFTIELITINRNVGYGTGWLLANLNSYNSDGRLRFFVLVVESLEFTSSYYETLFKRVIESKQILKVFVSNPPQNEQFKDIVIVVPPPPNVLVMKIFTADNLYVQLRTYNYNKTDVEAKRYEFFIDFTKLLQLDPELGGVCYKNCKNAPHNDSVCIVLPSQLNTWYDGDVRHLKFTSRLSCQTSIVKRSVSSYPDWFLEYLITSGMARVDRRLDNYTSRHVYHQAVDPLSAAVKLDDNYYNLCEVSKNYMQIKTLTYISYILHTKNGTRLPASSLADCYHLITTESNAIPLVYSVNITKIDETQKTLSEGEVRVFGGDDMFKYLPASTTSTTSTTTTTEKSTQEDGSTSTTTTQQTTAQDDYER